MATVAAIPVPDTSPAAQYSAMRFLIESAGLTGGGGGDWNCRFWTCLGELRGNGFRARDARGAQRSAEHPQ